MTAPEENPNRQLVCELMTKQCLERLPHPFVDAKLFPPEIWSQRAVAIQPHFLLAWNHVPRSLVRLVEEQMWVKRQNVNKRNHEILMQETKKEGDSLNTSVHFLNRGKANKINIIPLEKRAQSLDQLKNNRSREKFY